MPMCLRRGEEFYEGDVLPLHLVCIVSQNQLLRDLVDVLDDIVKAAVRVPLRFQLKIRREKTNLWPAITRLGCGVPLMESAPLRSIVRRRDQNRLAEPDHEATRFFGFRSLSLLTLRWPRAVSDQLTGRKQRACPHRRRLFPSDLFFSCAETRN
jgi:hypothetical protein